MIPKPVLYKPANLRDNYGLLKQAGIEILGVSPDDAKSHKKFETKQQLPFTLLADPKHTAINAYGRVGRKTNVWQSLHGPAPHHFFD